MASDLGGLTYTNYLMLYLDQMRQYDAIVPEKKKLDDDLKKTFLIKLVKNVPSLSDVHQQVAAMRTTVGHETSYEAYLALLLDRTSQLDDRLRANGCNKEKRSIYKNDLFNGYELDTIDDEAMSIDESYETYLTNGHSGYYPKLTREQWGQLSAEDRNVWDRLSDKGKTTIMNKLSASTNSSPNKRHEKHPNSPRKVNVHDMTFGDFMAFMQELQSTDTDDGENADVVDVNQTKVENKNDKSSSHPASLHKTLEKKTMGSNTTSQVSFAKLNIHLTDTYTISNSALADSKLSLIDRGANGGVGGEDVRLIDFIPNRYVDIQGIDNHQVTKVPIATVGGIVTTQVGERILIFHQYAYTGKGPSIHSAGQFEHWGSKVDDRSKKVGGKQCIVTSDGFTIPLVVARGLCRLKIRPYQDHEWDTIPHIHMTSSEHWDPTVLDHTLDDNEWKGPPPHILENSSDDNIFDEFGEYRGDLTVHLTGTMAATASATIATNVHHTIEVFNADLDSIPLDVTQDSVDSVVTNPPFTSEHVQGLLTEVDGAAAVDQVVTAQPNLQVSDTDYTRLRPLLAFLGVDVIKETLARTTQYARAYNSPTLKKHFHSPHPALNVKRRKEPIATDTIYSNTTALGLGIKHAQVFVGTESYVVDIYPLKSQTQFATVLSDVIRERGAPTRLLSDQARAEISKRVQDILRFLFIDDWQSEGDYQHQNFAERKIQDLKRICDTVMDRCGVPDDLWFECLAYVADILNHTYNRTLKDVPLRVLDGDTPDISAYLRFRFYEPVYYRATAHSFPSDSREEYGHFVGVSKNVGHAMTFKILTANRKIIHRSAVRSAITDSDRNFRAEPLHEHDHTESQRSVPIDGEMEPPTDRKLRLQSRHEIEGLPDIVGGSDVSSRHMAPVIQPNELLGRTFLHDVERQDGLKFRGRIEEIIGDLDDLAEDLEQNRERIQFRCSMNDGAFEEVLSYGQLMEFINNDTANPVVWKFRKIVDHQGPLKEGDEGYMGSLYNAKVEWENGEITWVPLDKFAREAPVECAIYAKAKNLLYSNGWRRFRHMARKKDKIFERYVKQAKLRSYNTAPRYKYGIEIPRNYKHAILLDERNGNKKWVMAVCDESNSMNDYSTFRDCGHKDKVRPPDGYKLIRVHYVFEVKHDGRHKARLVADGHLTDIPLDSIYAGVVSLKGLRLVVFIAKLNDLELYATDVGNAYLEAKTREKVYIIAGPEFGALEGHILVIVKALYGLRTSGHRWAERLADVLREMGFTPSKSEPDIWMRRCSDHYEYVAVYVDDLLVASKDPMSIINLLTTKYGFKLKGTGKIAYHLGMNLVEEECTVINNRGAKKEEKILSYAPRQYLERLFANYERIFGQKPRNYASPLEPNDHPELDTSEFLDTEKTKVYQSLIGALQWLVTIGRIDIFSAVMTMSSFRSEPRFGHMQRVQRIYGYLAKFRHSSIIVDASEPDYSTLPAQIHDWDYSVYGDVKEEVPHDAPEPLGKHVVTTTYVDANLYHDMLTGKAVTGILHMVNNTPYEWYSKKQATVETATYGSEFSAARTAVEQIIDLRLTLRYIGVPVRETSYMFGDNKSVVDSSSLPGSKLNKRHTMLSYHRVREAISSGMIQFHHIPGDVNPADLLSKHWSYAKVWKKILRPLLFLVGGTTEHDDGVGDEG